MMGAIDGIEAVNKAVFYGLKGSEMYNSTLWGQMSQPSTIAHLGLDAAGLLPGFGIIFDLGNAVFYGIEGDATNASLSAVAAVPGVGWFGTGGKWAVKSVKTAKTLKYTALAAKTAEAGYYGYQGVKTLAEGFFRRGLSGGWVGVVEFGVQLLGILDVFPNSSFSNPPCFLYISLISLILSGMFFFIKS